MEAQGNLYDEFRNKAELVSAKVSKIKSTSEAIDYITDTIKKDMHQSKIIAVPEFTDSQLDQLQVKAPDVQIIQKDLSKYTKGIPFAVTNAEFGIAETGTLVINSKNMDKRLATMIPDIHFAMLLDSKIVATAEDLIPELNKILSESSGYLAFVTGASRTADIERVLVVGVHGPLELHILIIEDA
jgi:L-lactate dehydrogenase complex protein LldG